MTSNRFFGETTGISLKRTDPDSLLFQAIVENDTKTAIELLKKDADAGSDNADKPRHTYKDKAALQWAFDNNNLKLFEILLCYGYTGFDLTTTDSTKDMLFKAFGDFNEDKEKFTQYVEEELLRKKTTSLSQPFVEFAYLPAEEKEKEKNHKVKMIEMQDFSKITYRRS